MNRDFKGVWIPKDVWLNKDLSIMEKLFLVEIDSLDGSKNCFASNAHFAEFFGISKGRCTQIIKSLEAKGFLKITLVKKGKLVQKRLIKVVNKLNQVVNKLNQGSEKTKSGYLENDEGSNTSNSNTKESRATTTPTNFEITKELSIWAVNKQLHINLVLETEKFINYNTAKGSKYKDWNAAWRNWMLNGEKYFLRDNQLQQPQGRTFKEFGT